MIPVVLVKATRLQTLTTGLAELRFIRDRKTHKRLQHKLFGPHSKYPVLRPQKKLTCLILAGKNAKRGPPEIYSAGFWGQRVVPNGPFWAATCVPVYFCFVPLSGHACKHLRSGPSKSGDENGGCVSFSVTSIAMTHRRRNEL